MEAFSAELSFGLSAESAVQAHAGPIGRCNNFLVEGVRAQFWASVRHLGRSFPAVLPARTLRFLALALASAAASAEHAEPSGRCYIFERVRAQLRASVRHFEKLESFCHFSVF